VRNATLDCFKNIVERHKTLQYRGEWRAGSEVLRALLVPATWLLTLCVLQGHQAYAIPSTTTGSPDAFCACWSTATLPASPLPAPARQPDNPTNGFASIATVPFGPAGQTTFAPLMINGGGSRASTSPFETISTISRTVVFEHAKPGMLAAVSSGWPNPGGSSVYVGTSSNLVLRDGSSSGSASPVYSVSPTGGPSAEASGDSKFAVAHAAYTPNTKGSSPAGFLGADGSKLSRSVAAGPVYAGSGRSNTPKPGQQSRVDFGTIQLKSSSTLDLALQNLAAAPGSISDLTVEGYTIAGADPGSFSVASLAPGAVIPAGGTLVVPITVVGTGPGDLTSDLTIFTNEGTSSGGAGDQFHYLLDPMVVAGIPGGRSAPEPASLAVLCAGLAGLASVRRRRIG
jgi:hypothetical protein